MEVWKLPGFVWREERVDIGSGKSAFFSGESLERRDGQSVNVKCQLVMEYHSSKQATV